MKNIEGLSKNMILDLKLEGVINNINSLLFSNLDKKEHFKDLK